MDLADGVGPACQSQGQDGHVEAPVVIAQAKELVAADAHLGHQPRVLKAGTPRIRKDDYLFPGGFQRCQGTYCGIMDVDAIMQHTPLVNQKPVITVGDFGQRRNPHRLVWHVR